MSDRAFHALRVASRHMVADDAVTLAFDVPAALRETFVFEPGQHLIVRQRLQGQELRRSYSVCAARGDGLRIGVRRVPGGVFSNWLHDTLREGDSIDAMAPQGRFGAAVAAGAAAAAGAGAAGAGAADAGARAGAATRSRHLLGVAGGSGITPVLSIVRTLLEQEPGCRVTLLYGNRTAASTMFRDELGDLKNRFMPRFALHLVFSREGVDSPLHTGRLDAVRIAALLRLAAPVDEAVVCGPHAFNDEAEAALQAAGLAAGQIHVERFGVPPALAAALPPPAHRAADAGHARITIVHDGLRRDIVWQPDDANVLAAATRAGMDLPFSCQSGVCATCRAKLLDGQVRMDRNFALEPADLQAGFVLTCQAHPVSERVVLSFDER